MSTFGSRVSQVRVSKSWREIVLGTARSGALRTEHRRGLLRHADDAGNYEVKVSPARADVERELERRMLFNEHGIGIALHQRAPHLIGFGVDGRLRGRHLRRHEDRCVRHERLRSRGRAARRRMAAADDARSRPLVLDIRAQQPSIGSVNVVRPADGWTARHRKGLSGDLYLGTLSQGTARSSSTRVVP